MPDRLQKLIARAGITSRRKAENLITEGRVTVNGDVVTRLGAKADLSSDRVCVDGKPLRGRTARRYLAMNKPKGCITTTSDPEGRPTVMDLIGPDLSKGLFPVGRLDYNTEGLLLLTNDGDFANHVLSAKNEVPRTYDVKVNGVAPEKALEKLRAGFRIEGRTTRPRSIRLLRMVQNPWYRITLVQGRNRQIHRMFERVGLLVEKIRRVSIGRITLRGLEPRQVRALRRFEVRQLLSEDQPVAEEVEGLPDPGPPPRQARRRPRGPHRERGREARGGRRSGSRARTGRTSTAGSRRPGRARAAGRPGRSRGQSNRRERGGFRREARPRRSPGKRRPSGGAPRARRAAPRRERSPGRSRAPSRGRRSSRPGTRARP